MRPHRHHAAAALVPLCAAALVPLCAAALVACAAALVACSGEGPSRSAEWDPTFPSCAPYQAPPVTAAPGTKFALSVYHYNVQYVVGGLTGWKTDPNFDMDNDAVEDAIVVEGLEPILDMYLRHPGWGADIEMQGYMVEVMAARHPAVLDKLRTLLAAGQVQLASVHYSDQLVLAYPAADMELSFARNEQALATGCVQAGASVFTQEGQFGEGLMTFLAGKGRTYAALPKNLFGYLHPELERAPLYAGHGMDVVLAGASVDDGDVSIRWTFVNDGELAPAASVSGSTANPYFGKLYVADPAVVAAHEEAIADLEAQGYAVTNIEAAVKALRALPRYASPPALPPILDCDWQPDDTVMLLRWMGDVGLNGEIERDNEVLTTNVRAREAVLAARVLVADAQAAGRDVTASARDLAFAERRLLWAEVSDATGWNPIGNEVDYALGHAARALEYADAIAAAELRARGTPHLEVDLAAATVTPLAALPSPPTGDPVAAPLEVTVTTARPYTTTWTQLAPDHYRLEVAFDAAPTGRGGAAAVSFPWSGEAVEYSPALQEDAVVSYPRATFAPDVTLALPLANGLIGLGDERWLIKDLHAVHLAAVLPPSGAVVEFQDNTFPGGETGVWVFEVIDGPAATALARARELNVSPKVRW